MGSIQRWRLLGWKMQILNFFFPFTTCSHCHKRARGRLGRMVFLPAQIKAGTVFLSTSFFFFSRLRDRLQSLGFCGCRAIVGLILLCPSCRGIRHLQGINAPTPGRLSSTGITPLAGRSLGRYPRWGSWSCTPGSQQCRGKRFTAWPSRSL